MNDKLKEISTRLKTVRIADGYKTAKEFAEKHDIPPSTYTLHESGRRGINPKVAKSYADYLGINLSWLLTGTGTAYQNDEHTLFELNENELKQISSDVENYSNKKVSIENELSFFAKIILAIRDNCRNSHENEIITKGLSIYFNIQKHAKSENEKQSMLEFAIDQLGFIKIQDKSGNA